MHDKVMSPLNHLSEGGTMRALTRSTGVALLLALFVSFAAQANRVTQATPLPTFTPQTRLGFTDGDQWEPAIATDRHGHVYVLYPQYKRVPGCPTCASPTMILQISGDRGATWGPPALMYP